MRTVNLISLPHVCFAVGDFVLLDSIIEVPWVNLGLAARIVWLLNVG